MRLIQFRDCREFDKKKLKEAWQSYLRDEEFKDYYEKIDPLAITLKMLDLIIEKMGPFSGITEDDLISEVFPLLNKHTIGVHEESLQLTENQKERLLERIFRLKNSHQWRNLYRNP